MRQLQDMSLTWESKIKKPAGKKANDTEKAVAKAIYDLQLTSDQLKSALKVGGAVLAVDACLSRFNQPFECISTGY